MAYNLGDRFNPDPKPFTLLDPGAYKQNRTPKFKQNAAPFLSKTPRNTMQARVWTHAIYDSYKPDRIPNCTALTSRRPRFPYEALSKEDLDDLLCRCGLENVCECTSYNEEPDVICQAKVPKRLYKGHPPRSHLGHGLSVPSKHDKGFDVGPDGSLKQLRKKITNEPPFYNSRVNELTAFYQGCKWSKWTSSRSGKQREPSPGPADYYFVKHPPQFKKCLEKLREYKRKTSKQLRFIEMVQHRNVIEAHPGPGAYSPKPLKGTYLEHLGAKTERFQESTVWSPGPADYLIKRSFEPPERPSQPCHCKLPDPAIFGVKALRFKPRKEEGPSPATYNPNKRLCQFMQCRTAPFGSSSVRFKENSNELDDEDLEEECNNEVSMRICPLPTWEFKSKTLRMPPLVKKFNEPSPADFPQPYNTVKRSSQFQYIAPFFSSEGRFQPWYDWMPVFNKFNTPGPCYYNLKKHRCLPAVRSGPLVRSKRFPQDAFQTPAPNEYKIGGGVDTVLNTHNRKLRRNMENQHKFCWEPPLETRKLTYQERESLLWNKSIRLLDDTYERAQKRKSKQVETSTNKHQPKLLRCFLYNHQFPPC